MRSSKVWLYSLGGVGALFLACESRPAPATSRSASTTSAQQEYRQPQRLIDALGPLGGYVVAEIGAGGGYLTLRLADAVGPSGKVVATDIDAQALGALSRRAAHIPHIVPRLVSAREPGLEENQYDLILLSEVDHLLPDRIAYLRTLRGALRPGGRIAISNRLWHLPALRAAIAATDFHSVEIDAHLPAQFLLMLSL